MTHYTIRIIGLGAAICAGTLAMAGNQGNQGGMKDPGMRPGFETLDADGDGQITRDEMQARHEARFARADADGDGRLTRDEMLAAAQKRAERRIDRMLARHDSDGDGALDEAEMAGMRKGRMMERMFDHMDADGDGAISRAEFDSARKMHHKGGGKARGKTE